MLTGKIYFTAPDFTAADRSLVFNEARQGCSDSSWEAWKRFAVKYLCQTEMDDPLINLAFDAGFVSGQNAKPLDRCAFMLAVYWKQSQMMSAVYQEAWSAFTLEAQSQNMSMKKAPIWMFEFGFRYGNKLLR